MLTEKTVVSDPRLGRVDSGYVVPCGGVTAQLEEQRLSIVYSRHLRHIILIRDHFVRGFSNLKVTEAWYS